jgi:hypothetical protein
MLKIKHKTLRSVEIQVIDTLRKIDADGWILDLTEVEQERLSHFDEFVVVDDEPIVKEKAVEVESEVEAESEVEDKPKRGRPAGTSKK